MKKRFKRLMGNKRGDGIGILVVVILGLLLVGIISYKYVMPSIQQTASTGNKANTEVKQAMEELENAAKGGEQTGTPGS